MTVNDKIKGAKKMKYFVIILFSVFTGFCMGHVLTKKEQKLDSKVYVPGMYRTQKSFMEVLGFGRTRGRSKISREKSYLKQLGTTVAMYYDDGDSTKYPENPNEYDIDLSLFCPPHLQGKYIGLPKDWKVPDSWEAFNQSNSPFVFIGNSNGHYTGSSDTPLFITRYGYQAGKDFYQLVYEDGHVSSISKASAIELWKKAGVWNDLD